MLLASLPYEDQMQMAFEMLEQDSSGRGGGEGKEEDTVMMFRAGDTRRGNAPPPPRTALTPRKQGRCFSSDEDGDGPTRSGDEEEPLFTEDGLTGEELEELIMTKKDLYSSWVDGLRDVAT